MSTPTASRQRVPGVAMWVEACYSTQPLFHLGPTQFVAFVECSRGTPIGPLSPSSLWWSESRLRSPTSQSIHGSSMTGHLWGLLKISQLPWTSLKQKVLRYVSTLTDPYLYSSSHRMKTVQYLLYLLKSLLLAKVLLSWEVLLVHLLSAKHHFCTRLRRSRLSTGGSGWFSAGDNIAPILSVSSQAFLHPLNMSPCHASSGFDQAVRECLELIIGGPISHWSWLKASLLSNRGSICEVLTPRLPSLGLISAHGPW